MNMNQPVYMDLNTYNGIRLMQQNSEENLQQQFIMSDQAQEQQIVQDDQSHVYASNEQQQYISQEEVMGQGQYLQIQQQAPPQQQSQQVFYANISPQNQNRIQQQQIALNQNLIAHQNQQKLVLQQAPKVVVQRNSDMLQQPTTNMAQIVDHRNPQMIQYHLTPQMDLNQTQQLILQQQPQQIKQTIYPQQQNQGVPQQYFLQQIQPNVSQQPKFIVQNGNRFNFVQQPKQIVSQTGQIIHLSQSPLQGNPQPRQFRPRGPVKLQVGNPQQSQQVILQQSPRITRPRIVRPQAQNPAIQQQTTQSSPRSTLPTVGRQVFILQNQPDGTSVLVPQPNFNMQGQQTQIVRTVQQKPVSTVQQQQYQIAPNVQQTTAVQTEVEETHPPATSTLNPKKDGDCDDLEDSITATAISKSARSEPPPLQPQSNSLSIDEYRKRLLVQQQSPSRVGVVRPIMNTNQLRMRIPAQQVIRQRPAQRPQYQIGQNQEIEGIERESAKMLVILDNGEQRLITFTLPKESCTVQELLDQVGIQVGADSNIECIENPGSEIDYIVKVGNFGTRDTAAMTKAAENHIRQQQRQQLIQSQKNNVVQQNEVTESKSPEPKALPPAKYVSGYYAVCSACGCSGIDHAKCVRCNRIFTEVPKKQRIPANIQLPTTTTTVAGTQTKAPPVKVTLEKKDQIEALQKKHQMAISQKTSNRGRGGLATSTPRGRGSRARAKLVVPEVVTLSSDDESDSNESKCSTSKTLKKDEEPSIPKKHYEPVIADDVVDDDFVRDDVTDLSGTNEKISTGFSCRTIRLGSYKYDSKEKVVITTKGIQIFAPSLENKSGLVKLDIQRSEIVKVVTHFSKQLHIIFLYTKPSCARYIADQLQMKELDDKSPFFSPISRSEPRKKIVFLPETVNEETKSAIKSIFTKEVLEEINNSDANELLVRSTGIPLLNKSAVQTPANNSTADASAFQEVEVRKLFIYPPGRGGIPINTHDYICLASDNYLNDVIIDFYLKYVHNEIITEQQRIKSHIFSTFFYKRMTRASKDDAKLSAAQKRHARVASWTKNVNIFEKDFVIIPINEQSHWFLAIICYPNLTEPHTMESNQPIKLQKRTKKKKPASVQIGSTTITPLSKKDETIRIADDEGSERDEAEGDESELEGNGESDEDLGVVDQGQPVKVPCILIFDSLQGAPRSRVVATLRDYLTCEYKAKFPNLPHRTYTKASLAACQVKVPQQNNFVDCGLFLLQYVEHFFTDPIKDFRLPIKTQQNWFHQDLVTRKREDIAKLIEDLIKRSTPEGIELPQIEFPTKNGQIIEQPEEEQPEQNAFDDSDYQPTEEDLKELEKNQNGSKVEQQAVEGKKLVFFPKKRSLDKNDSTTGETSIKIQKLNTKNKS